MAKKVKTGSKAEVDERRLAARLTKLVRSGSDDPAVRAMLAKLRRELRVTQELLDRRATI